MNYFFNCSWAVVAYALGLLVFGSPARAQSAQSSQLAITQANVVVTANSPDATLFDVAAVADGQGNTYLAGSFRGAVQFGAFSLTSADSRDDVFVAKRDAAGTYLWAVPGGGPGAQRGQALAVDAAGNVYVAGHFKSVPTAIFGSHTLVNSAVAGSFEEADAFVAKLNGTTRAWEWANRAGGGTRINGDDGATAVAVDGLGNVYVGGYFNSSVAFFGPGMGLQVANPFPGFNNAFLGKLTAAGTWVWAKGQQYMGLGGVNLAIDANQDVYMTGVYGRGYANFGPFTLTSRISEAFVAKIDGSGTWQWATGTGPTPPPTIPSFPRSVSMSTVAIDGARGLYVAGAFGRGAPNSPADTLIIGNTVLTNTGSVGPPGPSGNVLRTFDGYVARLDAATGAWRWAVQTYGAGDEFLVTPRVDGAGRVLVAGNFAELVASGLPGSRFGTTTLRSAGGSDLLVAQLDSTGRWLWARHAGGAASESAALCGLDAQGRGVLVGAFTGAATQLGSSTLAQFSPAQSSTFFTAVLGANGPLAVRPGAAGSAFTVYPNPARTAVSVAGLPPGQTVQVLDVLGRVLLAGTVPARGELQLALPAGLPAGLYLVRAGTQAQRLVVE
ncbi:T9SS type A sorting domain-containing protein [Hymenobacter antarcticus]|uniref:Por secretion system C-terminal sorting domain-containing protein n=1 Tax=Hymenobacter antarcticus TaxID=486270 RepID=A0ABP7QSW5_9BACT